jgi:tetratricopeptide (TPR) repeat protein
MLSDTLMQRLVRQSLEQMYNQEFGASEQLVNKVQQRHPGHPVYPLIKALNLYWKHLPIGEDSPAFKSYQTYLEQCVSLSKARLEKNPDDLEGTFFALSAYSYLVLQSSESGNYLKAVGQARKMYSYMKKGFSLTEKNPEFFLPTGVYNYYAEQYPESHPIVKPLMWFFADGDKARGLEQMKTGMIRSTFTKVEAAYRLLDVYAKHESQPLISLVYASRLVELYPHNLLFVSRYAEFLVTQGKHDSALPYLKQLEASNKSMYKRVAEVLRAYIQEKWIRNDQAALRGYLGGQALPANEKQLIRDFYGTAYAGAARIYARQGNATKAREYYKKAQDVAESRSTLEEAHQYLKKHN